MSLPQTTGMAGIFQRRPRGRLTCFYCNHTVTSSPKDRFRFVCPECSCLNRYDENGVVIGDEPAMRDEHLNRRAFAKRASPTKDRFMSPAPMSGSFCHTCRTNQALLINLLSNYLPPEYDPSYQSRLESLPSYRQSLEERYPPVCDNCQPMVSEEIRKKDFMAQTQALGRAANLGRRVAQQRKTISLPRRNIWVWRIRGLLWIMTACFSLCYHSSIISGFELDILKAHIRWLSAFYLFSVLWIFWDPTWLSAQQARRAGHPARVTGRQKYITCQAVIWVSRLCVADIQSGFLSNKVPLNDYTRRGSSLSIILLECLLYLTSIRGLSVRRPAPIRLISSSRSTPTPPELQRSYSQPPEMANNQNCSPPFTRARTASATRPVFGLPSLPNSVPPQVAESDAMDWTPTNPFHNEPTATEENKDYTPVWDREGWMKPPTFFPPEKPTGLESLLESTTLGGPPSQASMKLPQANLLRKAERVHKPKMTLLYSGLGGMFVTLVIGIFLYQRQPQLL